MYEDCYLSLGRTRAGNDTPRIRALHGGQNDREKRKTSGSLGGRTRASCHARWMLSSSQSRSTKLLLAFLSLKTAGLWKAKPLAQSTWPLESPTFPFLCRALARFPLRVSVTAGVAMASCCDSGSSCSILLKHVSVSYYYGAIRRVSFCLLARPPSLLLAH